MRLENSFIGVRGVGEKTERNLWREGVTHWDEFERSRVSSTRGLGETTADRIESFLADARERLDDGDSRFFGEQFPSDERWRLYENFRDETLFFDIETTGLDEHRNDVTTVSFHMDGETETLVRGQDLTAERVREQFDAASMVASFNGARFDVPFLEAELGVTPDVPHLDLMYPCKRVDLTGGLKRIEREIGLERDQPDISGRDAVRLWHQYQDGDERALETLVEYNRDDTRNLRVLADEVVTRLDDHVRPSDFEALSNA
ncbi:exonuclease [Halorubellus sp. JP-L1]|uniref:ribonuclease H-like domain-containing protein n=1 Tax=Halorubellus sp. JP-L1 TaxID=2715753 RepID=UPI00140CC3EC|nr:exonuclease [Halorubellus sp. JP-L1]